MAQMACGMTPGWKERHWTSEEGFYRDNGREVDPPEVEDLELANGEKVQVRTLIEGHRDTFTSASNIRTKTTYHYTVADNQVLSSSVDQITSEYNKITTGNMSDETMVQGRLTMPREHLRTLEELKAEKEEKKKKEEANEKLADVSKGMNVQTVQEKLRASIAGGPSLTEGHFVCPSTYEC